ncbi:homeodomain-like protein [Tanacetum coccineum]
MDSGYRHAISFQSNAINSTSEMMMMGDYYGMNGMNSTSGIMFSGNSGMGNSSSGFAQIGNSCATDAVAGLKHDAGLAVEWSVEEQYKLEEGISNYANEPTILRYIKISATLRDKTVRDVALRCQWMTSKRRKQDELKFGRKLKDKKDNLVESSSKQSISSISTSRVAPFSVTTNNRFLSGVIPMEASSVSTRHLLEQNNQVFGQISANMSALKLQDNINLFNHAKNNLTAILNDIRYMPGPPLPVSLNENLATTILPSTSPTMTFGSSSRMKMKQEPHY